MSLEQVVSSKSVLYLIVMKFFKDFDIFMLSMFRCPACSTFRIQALEPLLLMVLVADAMRGCLQLNSHAAISKHFAPPGFVWLCKRGMQLTCMEEVVHPLRLARAGGSMIEGLCLGELVFVVREGQVSSASVDVNLGADDAAGHSRALNVPACMKATARL